MKQFIAIIILLCLYCNIVYADCDDSPGPCWVTTLSAVGGFTGGILNAASISFNIYNVATPKPMNKTGRIFTYGTIAVGTITLATGVSLFAINHSRATSTNVYDSLVVGAGTMTLGTGIWSVLVDKKQKQHSPTVSVLPIMSHDKRFGTSGGLLLSKGF